MDDKGADIIVQECGERLFTKFDDDNYDNLATALSASSSDSYTLATISESSDDIDSTINCNSSETADVEQGKGSPLVYTQRQPNQLDSERKPSKKFLELCINTGDFHKTLGEIDLSDCTSDGDMFAQIRNTYSSIRVAGRRIFQRPVDIHFVQVRD